MVQPTAAASRRGILMSLGVMGVIAAIFAMPSGSEVGAVRTGGEGLFTGKKTHEEGVPNYDIRRDKQAFEKMAAFRGTANRSASDVADRREDLVRGETALKGRVPTAKIEYSPELGNAEVIAPDVTMGRSTLARATQQKKSGALRGFLRENKRLIGATDAQVDGLKLFADYKSPDGELGFVEYTQEINEIPVFRGAIRAAYSKDGELIRVINNFAPGLDYLSVPTEFGDASAALNAAARHIDHRSEEHTSEL